MIQIEYKKSSWNVSSLQIKCITDFISFQLRLVTLQYLHTIRTICIKFYSNKRFRISAPLRGQVANTTVSKSL